MEQTAEEAAVTPLLETGIPCPQCSRVFSNEQGLRMHKIRKHSSRGWNSAANFGTKRNHSGRKPSNPSDPSEAARLRKRRAYQQAA